MLQADEHQPAQLFDDDAMHHQMTVPVHNSLSAIQLQSRYALQAGRDKFRPAKLFLR
jgi:hypothetical protein